MLRDDGAHICHVLGDVVKYADCVGQVVVPHDTWYSAELMEGEEYALYSAVVMPGIFSFFPSKTIMNVGNKGYKRLSSYSGQGRVNSLRVTLSFCQASHLDHAVLNRSVALRI